MKVLPIIFSAPMVRALLAGRKTQTRRIIKDAPEGDWHCDRVGPTGWSWVADGGSPSMPIPLRFSHGDRLWVRENWQLHGRAADVCTVVYAASVNGAWSEAHSQFQDAFAGAMTATPFQTGWRPSIHLPRWASRLTLNVTRVRVERLQDISEGDARAEGLEHRLDWLPQYRGGDKLPWVNEFPRDAFADLWASIHGPGAWEANPWVVALTFTVQRDNVDRVT